MASQSTYNDIKSHVESSDRGTLFFPDTFASTGSSDAVRSALVRLYENGILIRVAQGIYYYPKIDTKWGSGVIPPSIDEIAEGIAKRDKVRIATTGAFALYQLGLSTQIPANVVFITDGSPRRVTIGKGRGILFKHTSEMRTFAYQSQLMGLTVTALLDTHQKTVISTSYAVYAAFNSCLWGELWERLWFPFAVLSLLGGTLGLITWLNLRKYRIPKF